MTHSDASRHVAAARQFIDRLEIIPQREYPDRVHPHFADLRKFRIDFRCVEFPPHLHSRLPGPVIDAQHEVFLLKPFTRCLVFCLLHFSFLLVLYG